MPENEWENISVSFCSDYDSADVYLYSHGHGQGYRSKSFRLTREEGLEIAKFITGYGRDQAIEYAIGQFEKHIFETRPLSDRITEKIELDGGVLKHSAKSIFRAMLIYPGRKKRGYSVTDVIPFYQFFIDMDDETALSFNTIGKKKLETIHQMQDVLKKNDSGYFLLKCESII